MVAEQLPNMSKGTGRRAGSGQSHNLLIPTRQSLNPMHEVSIVQALIESIDNQLAAQSVERATSVRVRRGSTFSGDALEQAFGALSPGTRLESAALLVETLDTRFTCTNCGHSQTITSDDLVGHFFLCPACTSAQEIDEAHDLELLEVRA